MRARPGCTPRRNSIRGTDCIGRAPHIVVPPWSPCTTSQPPSLLPRESSPRIDLPALLPDDLVPLSMKLVCAPVVTKMRHLPAARASVSVHLLATRRLGHDRGRAFRVVSGIKEYTAAVVNLSAISCVRRVSKEQRAPFFKNDNLTLCQEDQVPLLALFLSFSCLFVYLFFGESRDINSAF